MNLPLAKNQPKATETDSLFLSARADSYSKSLDIPLQAAKKTLVYSNALYALSQSLSFFVIALVFCSSLVPGYLP